MILIEARGVARYYGSYKLFDNLNFAIHSGERIGLIGQNGTGKTTLLQILAKELDYDGDDDTRLFFASGIRIAYLRQTDELGGDYTLWQSMQSIFAELNHLEMQMREHERLMSEPEVYNDPDRLTQINDRYGRMSHEFERQGGYVIHSRIRAILFGLGFKEMQFSQELHSLSGGERMRAALARQLLLEPDLLLLDEPTNHLDIAAVEWLEEYLLSYPGAVLLVSHDRYFLDRVVERVFEIENHTLTTYQGNYSAHLVQKEMNLKREMDLYLQAEAQRKHLQSFIDRFRYGTKATLAKSRAKMMARLGHEQAPKTKQARMNLELLPRFRSANRVIMLHGLRKAYEKPLFGPLDLEILRGERIALVGPNGAGKTTLLSVITGELEPDAGECRWGVAVDWGFYKQGLDDLEEENTILDEILEAGEGMTVGEARDVLGRFLFQGEDVYKKVAMLSGGERSRVMLAKLFLLGANCLLLDEPTNHLDIPAREVLEEALQSYDGTLLVVSHDRYFVDRVATKIWELKDGVLRQFRGGWSDYHSIVQAEAAAAELVKQRVQQQSRAVVVDARDAQRRKRDLQRETERLEAAIAELEREKLGLEWMMSEAKFVHRPDRDSLLERYQQLPALIEQHLEDWENASAELLELEADST